MEEERTVIIMDDQTFHFKAKENLNNDMNMIELLTTQAKETNNSIYWYLLFKHVNNYYIDFNPNNVKGIEYLDKAIELEEKKINGKSFYKLDYEYMVLLSKINNYIANLVAAGTQPTYKYIEVGHLVDIVDLSKIEGLEFDVDYLIYMSRLYFNDIRVNYKCSLICLKLIPEKYYEKVIIKSLLDMKINYHKDIKKIKKLSDFDKVTLLKKYASYIFS
jgi:hypothetical protein